MDSYSNAVRFYSARENTVKRAVLELMQPVAKCCVKMLPVTCFDFMYP